MRKRDRVKKVFSKVLDFEIPMLVGGLITVLLLTSFDSKGAEQQCDFLSQLSPYQQDIAHMSYRAGQPYDLGLTTVAIAWEESRLGIYKVRFNSGNIKDVSVGVMHTVAYWKTKGMTSFEAGQWVQDMIEIDQKSIDVGVQDIIYWQARAKGDWKKGVGMYNGGSNPNTIYTRRIADTVNRIKLCNF